MKGIIGKKVGMTQVYDEKGVLIPVTVIQAGPCVVLDVKTIERDGYASVQYGFGSKKAKNVSKAVKGSVAKAGLQDNPPEVIKEFRLCDGEAVPEIGSVVKADILPRTNSLTLPASQKEKATMVLWFVITSRAAVTDMVAVGTGSRVQSVAVKARVTL